VQIKKQLFFILKPLAHSMRLKLLMLRESNRLTVGELADPSELRNDVASEYLRLMIRCGFLSFGKKGKKTFYQISEPPIFFN
jgi:DNA-binding IclR family transcriptional regulator